MKIFTPPSTDLYIQNAYFKFLSLSGLKHSDDLEKAFIKTVTIGVQLYENQCRSKVAEYLDKNYFFTEKKKCVRYTTTYKEKEDKGILDYIEDFLF